MLLDLLPLFVETATTATTVVTGGTGGTSGPLRNPLPPHRQSRRLRDDDEAILVAALI